MDTPAVETQAVPGPGAMLRMAREARGTTIAEVAAALKMSPRQIEAMEREDFSRLSGATFIRGFIRNYARLLNIDAGPVLAALAEQTALPQAELAPPADSGVRMPLPNARQGKSALVATIAALAVFGVALALYFDVISVGGMLSRPPSPSQASAKQAPEPQVLQPQPQQVGVAQAQPAEGQIVESRTGEANNRIPPKPGSNQLIFSFDGSSWVEVKDATGRTVFSQMNAKGTTQIVEGRPPFQLVVGNASHVRLQYNDQPVDLRPHTRVEVARLTLD